MHKKRSNLFTLLFISLLAISLLLATKLVQKSQDDRSRASETSDTKINLRIAFKGVKPDSSCISTLQGVNLNIVNITNKIFQSETNTTITPVSGETNKQGDQIFLISNLSLNSSFKNSNSSNYFQIKSPLFLSSKLCLNHQSSKVSNSACNLSLANGTTYDFTKYSLTPGDLNQDGIVNASDFSMVKYNVNPSADSQCGQQTDLNYDGITNSFDLTYLKKSLLQTNDEVVIDPADITPTNKPTLNPTLNLTPTSTFITTLTPTKVPTLTPTKIPTVNYKIHFIRTTRADGNVANDAILLESKGKYGLIDGGWKDDFSVISSYFSEIGVKKLDFFLITHPHADHYGSYKQLIERYKPETLYKKRFFGGDIISAGGLWTKEVINWYSNLEKDIKTICDNNEVSIVNVDVTYNDGWFFNLDKTKITLLNVPDRREKTHSLSWVTDAGMENRNSLIQLIEMNGFKIAMFGDLSWSEWYPYYAKKIGKVDLTKVGHHSIEKNENNKIADFLRSPYLVVTNKNKTDVETKMKKYAGSNIYYTGNGNIVFDFSSQTIKISK